MNFIINFELCGKKLYRFENEIRLYEIFFVQIVFSIRSVLQTRFSYLVKQFSPYCQVSKNLHRIITKKITLLLGMNCKADVQQDE